MTEPLEVAATRHRLNEAVVAVERGSATDEQRVLLAAFDAAVKHRLAYTGPTYDDRPLPEPILRAFIELVRAAGGTIRVPYRILTDHPAGYELVVADDPATGDRVFRTRLGGEDGTDSR